MELNKERLDDYLKPTNTTIDSILGRTDAFVFGGCLAYFEGSDGRINDIDICGFGKSMDTIRIYLQEMGFTPKYGSPLSFGYHDMKWFKVEEWSLKGRYIQLIILYTNIPYSGKRLCRMTVMDGYGKIGQMHVDNTIDVIKAFVGNVDIDVCGTMYHPHTGWLEAYPGAFKSIHNGVFNVVEDNRMHSDGRIDGRVKKYVNKGFTQENHYLSEEDATIFKEGT